MSSSHSRIFTEGNIDTVYTNTIQGSEWPTRPTQAMKLILPKRLFNEVINFEIKLYKYDDEREVKIYF